MMRHLIPILALLTLAGSANAGSLGPYSYYSNGYTTTNPPANFCPAGSNCVIRNGPPLLSDLQIVDFRLTTGSSFPGTADDHYAFGVRGNTTTANCHGYPNWPLLGRGVALYPNQKMFFENFSVGCFGTNGGTLRQNLNKNEIDITLTPNTTYWISLWADNYDTGIEIWSESYTGGTLNYTQVASARCRDIVDPEESASCGRHPNDQFYGNRTFIAYTATSQWWINDWWLHD